MEESLLGRKDSHMKQKKPRKKLSAPKILSPGLNNFPERAAKKLWEICLDWLFPHRCALCDRVVGQREFPVCRQCRTQIRMIGGPRCLHCGKPLTHPEQEYCRDCAGRASSFDRGIAPFVYGGAVQDSLMRFKYQGRQEYASFYAAMIDRAAGDTVCHSWKPEVMIPVPLHTRRYQKRGYNQAEVLAAALSELWKIPVDSGSIRRAGYTKPQKGLNARERKKNLKGAFALTRQGAQKHYRCILLVDDIYTTGSTVEEMARIFRERGTEKIYVVTVCVGGGT